MKVCKSRKLHHCRKCNDTIWPNSFYYPQRKNKALCLKCGRKSKTTLTSKFLTWLGSHGSK